MTNEEWQEGRENLRSTTPHAALAGLALRAEIYIGLPGLVHIPLLYVFLVDHGAFSLTFGLYTSINGRLPHTLLIDVGGVSDGAVVGC